ncbi:MAG TPA: 3'-5' exonuclease, partial [Methylomirabilota bacterium]|nr:3'-5' exonuclease [Methylomirabilota bacterium]
MDYFYTNAYLRGNKIFLRGYSQTGKRFVDDIAYKPFLFVPGAGDYQTIYGEPLIKKDFDSIKAAREFIELYNSSSNVDFYGSTNFTNVFLCEEFPNKVNYDPKLISIVSLDIEVSSKEGMPDIDLATQPVTAITLVRNKKTITFGTKAYTGKNSYCLCNDEGEMLRSFLHMLNNDPYWMPDVITGWSVDLFDIPYLINRVRRVLGEDWVKKFSPYGQVYQRNIIRAKSVQYSKKEANDRTDIIYDLAGIAVLDYLQLYKKFSPVSQESYALNNIAKVELGRGKHDFSDVGTLDDLFLLDFNRYIDYNVEDAILVEEIEQKKKYLQIIFSIAYKAKINYIDAMTTSRPWDAIIHNHLLKKNIAIPQPKEPPLRVDFIGGYVKEPQVGLHHWVVSFDFDALYPTILSQHNISPETFEGKVDSFSVEWCLTHMNGPTHGEGTCTANGCLFRTDKKGFIPEIVDEYIQER